MRLLAIGSAIVLAASAFIGVPTTSATEYLISQAPKDAPDTYIVDLFSAPTLDDATDAPETPQKTTPEKSTPDLPAPEKLIPSSPTPAPSSESDSATVEDDAPTTVTPEETATENTPDSTEAPIEEQQTPATETGVGYTDSVSTHGDVTYSESRITTLSRSFGNDVVPSKESVTTLAATSDIYDLFTAPLSVDEYQVVGITWDGDWPSSVEIRTEINGQWLDWYSLEFESTADGGGATEPYMAAGASGIQVRAQYAEAPTNFQVHLETGAGNGGTTEEAEVAVAEEKPAPESNFDEATNDDAGVQPASLLSSVTAREDFALSPTPLTATAVVTEPSETAVVTEPSETAVVTDLQTALSTPEIVSRSEWGAPAKASWRPKTVKLTGAIIHHTAGSNTYTQAQSAGLVRGIWNYHDSGQGWGDIGYNFLVDKYGTIYEGREGSLTAKPGYMSVGAHAAPANTNSVGIAVMGEYTKIQPTTESIDSVVDVLAWQFSMANVNPLGTRSYVNNAGATKTISTVAGHKDVSATACPGLIYNQLGTIRSTVAKKIDESITAPTMPSSNHYTSIISNEQMITTHPVSIRATASVNGAEIIMLTSGSMVLTGSRGFLNDAGHWLNVQLGKVNGWIPESYLAPVKESPFISHTAAGKTYKAVKNTPIYSVSSNSGSVLATAALNTRLVSTGLVHGAYTGVTSGIISGWVLTSTLSPTGTYGTIIENLEYITNTRAGVYQMATPSSPLVASLPSETMILTGSRTFTADGKTWWQVKVGSKVGWIQQSDIGKASTHSSVKKTAFGSKFLLVTASYLQSVTNPQTSVLQKLTIDTVVNSTGLVHGSYTKISAGDKVGWVLSKSLLPIKELGSLIPNLEYVTTARSAMRAAPSSNASIINTVSSDTMLTTASTYVITDETKWWKVQQGNTLGWIASSSIVKASAYPRITSISNKLQYTVTVASKIMDVSSEKGHVITSLQRNSSVRSAGFTHGYYTKVTTGTKSGWVLTKNLKRK